MKWLRSKLSALMVASLIVATPLLWNVPSVGAAPLISRSVRVSSSLVDVTTSHNFIFTIPTAGTIGSIEFEYCENDPLIGQPCNAPNGLSLSSALVASQTGETGFSIHPSSTANRLVLTRPPSANLAFQAATYNFSDVVNPADNNTTFVRIGTFASDDGTGARNDAGAVAFATTPNLQVTGFVPPYLIFCTGITVALDCTSANGDFISLGELSKTSANVGTSQFSGSTNDPGGFSTSLSGTTMTSGNNIISALSSPGGSTPGSSQFGINLRANSNPSVGQNRVGPGTSVATSDYNTLNNFKLSSQVIVNSPLPTEFNRFTVSYLVNVAPNQPAGFYSATLTYIASAAF